MTQPQQQPQQQPQVVAPVTATARPINPIFTALADMFRPRRKKHKANLQHIIETKLEVPVFFVVTGTMIVRVAQIFSGGALIMSALLGKYYPAFEIVTGLGLGLGSEMLMTIAGRSWRNWSNEATETAARTGMSKVAKDAYKKKAETNAGHSKKVMFVGMGSSLFGGLSYLFTNSGKPLSTATFTDPQWYVNLLVDLVAVTVVTTTVFYLGVLKESRGMSEAEEALSELDEGLNDAVKAAIQRFREQKQTPTDEKLIAEHLSPGRKAKFLRSVAKANRGKVWTAGELRKRLGYGNDQTKVRKLNLKINELAKDPENGLEKPDGRTWQIPVSVIWEVWGDDINQHDAELLAAQMVRPMPISA